MTSQWTRQCFGRKLEPRPWNRLNARAAPPSTAVPCSVTTELCREKLKKNKGISVVRIGTTRAQKKRKKNKTTRTSKNMKIVYEKDIIKYSGSQNIKLQTLLSRFQSNCRFGVWWNRQLFLIRSQLFAPSPSLLTRASIFFRFYSPLLNFV